MRLVRQIYMSTIEYRSGLPHIHSYCLLSTSTPGLDTLTCAIRGLPCSQVLYLKWQRLSSSICTSFHLHLRFNSINERITQLTDRAIINESIMGFFIAVPKPTSLLHPPMNKYFIILCQFIIFTNRDNQAQAKCVKHNTHFLRSLIFNRERCFQFKYLMRYEVLTAYIAYSDLLNS